MSYRYDQGRTLWTGLCRWCIFCTAPGDHIAQLEGRGFVSSQQISLIIPARPRKQADGGGNMSSVGPGMCQYISGMASMYSRTCYNMQATSKKESRCMQANASTAATALEAHAPLSLD